MLEWTIAIALFAALLRYLWVSLRREPGEDLDTDAAADSAADSVRAALRPGPEVVCRASDFAALDVANEEVSRRPRVPAITTPLPNLKGISK
jgi:hypothetical protein